MNKNLVSIIIIIIVVILAGIYFIFPKSSEDIQSNIQSLSNSTSTQSTNIVAQDQVSTSTLNNINKNNMHVISIETNKGVIVFETYDADAPNTVNNFISLVNKKFYENVIFHRVIKGFMIQGGDPTGTGRGGPGYTFDDELNPSTESYKRGYKRGVVAMANAGPNTNGSQFFIMHQDTPLSNDYTIFGNVVSGMEVVDAIANTQTAPGDRPISEIVIKKVTVSDKIL